MILFHKIPTSLEGKNYEIRVLYDDTTINVVAFLDNHPANGYRYQVKIPKGCDAKGVLEKYDVAELVEKSKDDIIEKRWEKLSKTIHENTANV